MSSGIRKIWHTIWAWFLPIEEELLQQQIKGGWEGCKIQCYVNETWATNEEGKKRLCKYFISLFVLTGKAKKEAAGKPPLYLCCSAVGLQDFFPSWSLNTSVSHKAIGTTPTCYSWLQRALLNWMIVSSLPSARGSHTYRFSTIPKGRFSLSPYVTPLHTAVLVVRTSGPLALTQTSWGFLHYYKEVRNCTQNRLRKQLERIQKETWYM